MGTRVNILMILWLAPAFAQDFRANLAGHVSDPSGAPVSSAAIRVRNVDTNETAVASTDAHGNYAFALLKPGNYELRAAHPGFKEYVRRGLTLSVNQSATVDVKLDLGAVAEQVTVTAETPLLDQSSGDRGGVIDEETIKEMPLNARNPFMLSMLVAGVNYNGSLAYQRPFDNGAIASWGINGGANGSNEFLMDGVPNNAQAGGSNIALVPPVDSVLEFKVQTNSYDAQYGKTAGGIMNAVLKSGTNKLHGSLYEFARRNAWDANSFQNNARGAPKEGHFLDQYGVQLDGPVVLPKLYDGHNRTFFLFNYEGYREATPLPLILSVPALEMRDGDFSRLTDSLGRRIAIHDPATGFTNPAFGNRWDRLTFPGNIMPKSRLHPISRRLLDYFPSPNTTTGSTEYSQSNFFISGGTNSARDNFYNFVVKIDQNLGQRHRFFFRHASNDRTEDRTTNGVLNSPGQDGQKPLKRVNDSYVLDWVSTVSPTVIFNLKASFARYIEGSRGDANAGFDITSLGFPQKLASVLPYGPFFGRYTFDSYISLGRYPSNNITNTITLHPNIIRIRGSKSIKGGFDMRWTQYSTQNYGNVLTLGASKGFTQRDYQRADDLSGNAIASWLLGTPSSGSLNYNVFPIFLFPYYAPWTQFDWKLTPRLTLNAGLRMDFNVPPHERFDRMNRGFDAGFHSPINEMIDRAQFSDFPEIKGAMRFAGLNGTPRGAANPYRKAIQPRFGFAYAINSKTVLRGGFGRSYVNPNNDYLQTNGFSLTTPLVFSTNESRSPVNNKIEDPFPTGIQIPYGNALGPLAYTGRGFNFVNANFQPPHVHSFSLGFQRAISSRSKFELTYSGSRGIRTQNTKVFNEDDASFRDRCNFALGGNPTYCDQQLPNPFFGVAPFEGTSYYTSRTTSRSQLYRPYPQFTGITELMRNDGANWYNSLQSIFTIRNKRVNLNANYTFSKNIERNGFLDPLRDVMQQGLVAYDRPHRFVVSAVAQIPFKGRNRFLKGWESTGIFQYNSGRPWDLPGTVMYLKDATLPMDWSRARLQAVAPCVNRWNEDNTITMMPFSRDYGCKEANWLLSPRFNPRYTPFRDSRVRYRATQLVDASLNKMTSINERYRVQFRAEVFNLLNSFRIVNQGFNNTADSANFGSLIKDAVSAPNSNWPRQVQLAVKFIW